MTVEFGSESASNGGGNRIGNEPRPAALRSRVTNGKALFAQGGDGRGPWARRMRDVIELHISDLGGIEAASEAQKSIIRRAATLTIELERLEAKFSAGKAFDTDLDMYQRCSNSLRRLLEAVGIQRRPRDVTPSVSEDLASKATEAASQ